LDYHLPTMTNTTLKLRSWDLVLGGTAQVGIPTHALVLGGLAGAQRQINSPNKAARLAGIPVALGYGAEGIELLIESLQSNSEWPVRLAIWQALSQQQNDRCQWATRQLSPFRDVGGSQAVIVAYRRGERDFSYAELAEMELNRTSLGGINCFAANLKAAQLESCNLNGIQCVEADLRGTRLAGSKLSGGCFDKADLRGADLRGCKLSGTSWRGCRVDETTEWDPKAALIWQLQNRREISPDLSQVDLSKSDLQAIELKAINLSKANLIGVDLRGSRLENVNLSQANLTRADLRGANLSGSDLSGALLTKANLSQANLSQTDLSKADLTKTNLTGVNLTGAIVEGSIRSETQVEGVTFADGRRARPWWW